MYSLGRHGVFVRVRWENYDGWVEQKHVVPHAGDGPIAPGFANLWTSSTLPIELAYVVPASAKPGQDVCVQGPHGPLMVKLPEGSKPGEPVKVRVGPAVLFQATVPSGKSPGDEMVLALPDGTQIQITIPEGKAEGDVFQFTPPVLMVQVPEGAREGTEVRFRTPTGHEQTAIVPAGVPEKQYFEVPL